MPKKESPRPRRLASLFARNFNISGKGSTERVRHSRPLPLAYRRLGARASSFRRQNAAHPKKRRRKHDVIPPRVAAVAVVRLRDVLAQLPEPCGERVVAVHRILQFPGKLAAVRDAEGPQIGAARPERLCEPK